MVVDNADDSLKTESGGVRLIDFLPRSRKGSVVFTTRALEVVGELDEKEAKEVMKARPLPNKQHLLEDNQVVHTFLKMLAFLVLAIVQTVAPINKENNTPTKYLSVCRDSEDDAIKLLRKEFKDHGQH